MNNKITFLIIIVNLLIKIVITTYPTYEYDYHTIPPFVNLI